MPYLHVDDVDFFVRESGEGSPLILLHGFTGSSQSWSALVDLLGDRHRVISVDLLGHGQTDAPADASRYQFARALDDLAAISHALGIGGAAWLGYSMGGRLALAFALHYPELVSSLILESASPGIADPAERERRRVADLELAATIEQRGVGAFVADWERLPLWHSQRSLREDTLEQLRRIRLDNQSTGLAGSLRGMGSGAQSSLWNRLGEVQTRALLIAGALDAKFAEIAVEMSGAIPCSELFIVENAGHAVHLEQPERFATRVLDFLKKAHAANSLVSQEECRAI